MPVVTLCPICRGRGNSACPYCRGSGLGVLGGFFDSIKKAVKDVGKVAKEAAPYLPAAAGIAAAPFTGGASLAIGAGATGQLLQTAAGKKQAEAEKEAARLAKKAAGIQAGSEAEAAAAGGRSEAWKRELKAYWPFGLAAVAVGAIIWVGLSGRKT